ncbi:hypothetical protein AX17_001499 [Amanita inopinata Kibby_2008]|nr:hypothetical protein AX17_001499 [Amanita inopinata Kibby_2008]
MSVAGADPVELPVQDIPRPLIDHELADASLAVKQDARDVSVISSDTPSDVDLHQVVSLVKDDALNGVATNQPVPSLSDMLDNVPAVEKDTAGEHLALDLVDAESPVVDEVQGADTVDIKKEPGMEPSLEKIEDVQVSSALDDSGVATSDPAPAQNLVNMDRNAIEIISVKETGDAMNASTINSVTAADDEGPSADTSAAMEIAIANDTEEDAADKTVNDSAIEIPPPLLEKNVDPQGDVPDVNVVDEISIEQVKVEKVAQAEDNENAADDILASAEESVAVTNVTLEETLDNAPLSVAEEGSELKMASPEGGAVTPEHLVVDPKEVEELHAAADLQQITTESPEKIKEEEIEIVAEESVDGHGGDDEQLAAADVQPQANAEAAEPVVEASEPTNDMVATEEIVQQVTEDKPFVAEEATVHEVEAAVENAVHDEEIRNVREVDAAIPPDVTEDVTGDSHEEVVAETVKPKDEGQEIVEAQVAVAVVADDVQEIATNVETLEETVSEETAPSVEVEKLAVEAEEHTSDHAAAVDVVIDYEREPANIEIPNETGVEVEPVAVEAIQAQVEAAAPNADIPVEETAEDLELSQVLEGGHEDQLPVEEAALDEVAKAKTEVVEATQVEQEIPEADIKDDAEVTVFEETSVVQEMSAAEETPLVVVSNVEDIAASEVQGAEDGQPTSDAALAENGQPSADEWHPEVPELEVPEVEHEALDVVEEENDAQLVADAETDVLAAPVVSDTVTESVLDVDKESEVVKVTEAELLPALDVDASVMPEVLSVQTVLDVSAHTPILDSGIELQEHKSQPSQLLSIAEEIERPKSPWTPSFQVTTVGRGASPDDENLDEEGLDEESAPVPDVAPTIMVSSTDISEVEEDEVTTAAPVVTVDAAETVQVPSEVEVADLKPTTSELGSDISGQPLEPPPRPWTPSYSVHLQGSPMLVAKDAEDDVPAIVDTVSADMPSEHGAATVDVAAVEQSEELAVDDQLKEPDMAEVIRSDDEVVGQEEFIEQVVEATQEDSQSTEEAAIESAATDEVEHVESTAETIELATDAPVIAVSDEDEESVPVVTEEANTNLDASLEPPARPWTPSYSVHSQGSPMLATREIPSDDVPLTDARVSTDFPAESEDGAAGIVDQPEEPVVNSQPESDSSENVLQASDEKPVNGQTEVVEHVHEVIQDAQDSINEIVVNEAAEQVAEDPSPAETTEAAISAAAIIITDESTSNEESVAATSEEMKLSPEPTVEPPARPWTPSYSVHSQGSGEPEEALVASWTPSYSVHSQGSPLPAEKELEESGENGITVPSEVAAAEEPVVDLQDPVTEDVAQMDSEDIPEDQNEDNSAVPETPETEQESAEEATVLPVPVLEPIEEAETTEVLANAPVITVDEEAVTENLAPAVEEQLESSLFIALEPPSRPWTPLYSVHSQGSPMLAAKELEDDVPAIDDLVSDIAVVEGAVSVESVIEIGQQEIEVEVPADGEIAMDTQSQDVEQVPVAAYEDQEPAVAPEEPVPTEEESVEELAEVTKAAAIAPAIAIATAGVAHEGLASASNDKVELNLEAALEPPARPWTPSYSVHLQGSPMHVAEALPAEDVPVEVDQAPSESTTDKEVVTAEGASTQAADVMRLQAESNVVENDHPNDQATTDREVSEHPKIALEVDGQSNELQATWVPSYSVNVQGSPMVEKTEEEAWDATKQLDTEDVATSDPTMNSENGVETTITETAPGVDKTTLPVLSISTDDTAPSQEATTNVTDLPEHPWTPSYSVTRQGPGVSGDEEELDRLEPLPQSLAKSYAPVDSEQTEADEDAVATSSSAVQLRQAYPVSEGLTKSDQFMLLGLRAIVAYLWALPRLLMSSRLEPVDSDGSTGSRTRPESTSSSRLFPGGWFTPKPNEGRTSLDVAQGEFSSNKGSVSDVFETINPEALLDGSAAGAGASVSMDDSDGQRQKWRCDVM